MAEELRRVRREFVDKSSKSILSQLLDDLVQDSILNNGEKDNIEEEFRVTRERAQKVIDTVMKKGDDASWKMIAHLEKRDRFLFTDLGLTLRPSPAPAAAPSQISNKTSSGRGETNSNYLVTEASMKNRVALLITNIKFTEPAYDRRGAGKDQENMESIFTSLNYEVVSYTNLTGQQIEDAVIKFSKHPKLKDTDSVFVIIMSHGKLGHVLGVGKQPDEFPLNDIYEHLSPAKCPSLLDKPKIIIIQACRGEHSGKEFVEDFIPEASGGVSRSVHKEKDFLSLLSCTPDTVSYRHPENGSMLIQHFVDVFKISARDDHIEELFRKVMQRFEESIGNDKFQMPTKDRCTLTKNFYFFPR